MDNGLPVISYAAHEGEMNRLCIIIKKLIIALIICVLLIFASNCVWLYAWMQYDYTGTDTTKTVTVDGKDGVANYIGNDGDITNGTDSGQDSYTNTNKDAEKCQ